MEAIHVYPTKDQEEAVIAFLEAMQVQFDKHEELPEYVLKGIETGREEIREGLYMTLEEFINRKRPGDL
ncbi:MAG: hypothetical protein BGO21_23945 [Dyadobacter sp. 50-39]|uniref:hypothetical protein n=1 Tax=Dyadobacter sp. 50-39 TaxID=1895756 RepID=UPI00095D53AE|nr:hypothetical protein [Dyadobacter sp. 50-39]OJV18587.1 MAG: hypothetical protein BGO21_23945 [Dyadobacter sp. 50-39]